MITHRWHVSFRVTGGAFPSAGGGSSAGRSDAKVPGRRTKSGGGRHMVAGRFLVP